jgi:hypothetical protein
MDESTVRYDDENDVYYVVDDDRGRAVFSNQSLEVCREFIDEQIAQRENENRI